MSDQEPPQDNERGADVPVASMPIAQTVSDNQADAQAVRLSLSDENGREYTSEAAESRWTFRLLAALFGIVPIVLLGITTQLSPSSEGLGTHQQLGLPPCSARVIFGMRCPACGMTTSWAHFVRGQWIASPRVNLGGFLLAFYALAFAAASLWSAKHGRIPGVRVQQWYTVVLMAIAGITLVDWGVRLGWGG